MMARVSNMLAGFTGALVGVLMTVPLVTPHGKPVTPLSVEPTGNLGIARALEESGKYPIVISGESTGTSDLACWKTCGGLVCWEVAQATP